MDEEVMVFKGHKYKQADAIKDLSGNSLCTGCDLNPNDACLDFNLHQLEESVFGDTCTQSNCIYVKALTVLEQVQADQQVRRAA